MQKFFLIFAVALSIAGAALASQKSTPNEDEMIMASVEALSNDEVVVGNTGPAKEKNGRIVINLCLLYKKLTFADKNELRWKRTRISNWRNAFCPKR